MNLFFNQIEICHLQQLTSAIDSELKLGETATNYLKARILKLVTKDRIVFLIIDEVYTQKKVEYVNGKFYGMEKWWLNQNITLIDTINCRVLSRHHSHVSGYLFEC